MAKRLIKTLENPIKLPDDKEATELFIDSEKLAKDLDSAYRLTIIKTIENKSKEMDKGKDILSDLKKGSSRTAYPSLSVAAFGQPLMFTRPILTLLAKLQRLAYYNS